MIIFVSLLFKHICIGTCMFPYSMQKFLILYVLHCGMCEAFV